MTSKKGRKKKGENTPNETHLVQFATRLPADLHRRLKVHCVGAGIALSEFTAKALTKALG